MVVINKKGVLLSSLSGLIIFFALFVAFLFSIRGCQGFTGESSASLNELAKVIDEVSQQNMASKNVRLEIDKDSAIIGYSKGQQLFLTKFKYTNLQSQQLIYPDNARGEEVNLNDLFDILDYVGDVVYRYPKLHPYFYGYIKQRPDSCSQQNACICFCSNIYFETKTDSNHPLYNTKNAYLLCKRETCINLDQNIEITEELEASYFFSTISDYYESHLAQDYVNKMFPYPNKVFWENGFIILRGGFESKKETVAPSLFNIGDSLDEDLYRVELNHFYAGYMYPYNLRFIDLEVSNVNGKIFVKSI